MNDEEKQLDALTNQRIPIVLGEITYSARKATLKDFAQINRFRYQQQEKGEIANIDLDVALYALSLLLQPDHQLTKEQLEERIPLDHITDINKSLEQLGFKLPQKDTLTAA